MIIFSDASNRVENIDYSNIAKYKNIKPCGELSKAKALEFWKDVFQMSKEYEEISEEQIISDVYGCSMDNFSFEFNVSSADISKVLDRFEDKAWEEMSEDDKEDAIRSLIEAIASQLEIHETPVIEYYVADNSDCGSYVPDKNVIRINRKNFYNPQEIVDTVAHETRHAYQFQHANNIETYQDYLYSYNFSNYIAVSTNEDGYINFIDYQDQLVEAEARAFAALFRREEIDCE